MNIKRITFYFLLTKILIFTSIFVLAEGPKNYIKGKFYNSIRDNFLVATEKMTDPRFKKTVIVMFESDQDGAWGLVINKPIGKIPLKMLIDIPKNKREKLGDVKVPIYWGGPVDENRIYILHSDEYKSKSTMRYNNFSLSIDYDILYDIAEKKGPKKNIIILGYSGWASGQVEGEMERNHWILSEIKTDLIFNNDMSNKWKSAYENAYIPL